MSSEDNRSLSEMASTISPEDNSSALGGNTSVPVPPFRQMMDNTTFLFVYLVMFYTVTPVAFFGLLTNTANIIVFYKMGFSVVSNITLFALAISDLFNVTYTIFTGFANHPSYYHVEMIMPFADMAMRLVPLSHCNQAFGSWVTAIISVERCCCVMFPVKVKIIFTRKTVFWLMIGMLFFQLSGTPQYASIVVYATISPRTNRTIYVIDHSKFKEHLAHISIFVSSSVPTFLCFITVTIATIFLIVKFKQSRQVRKDMAGKKQETISAKDAVMIRSVIFICIIYIIGYFPNVAIFATSFADSTFHLYDPYKGNLVRTLLSANYLCQAMSCSVNIFVYLTMSSKFKEIFKSFFTCKR